MLDNAPKYDRVRSFNQVAFLLDSKLPELWVPVTVPNQATLIERTQAFSFEAVKMKRCSKCGRLLSLSEFYWRRKEQRHESWCKDCFNAQCKKYRQSERGKRIAELYRQSQEYEEKRARHRETVKYKMTTAHYQQTDNYRLARRRYDTSDKGKAAKGRYERSNKGKAKTVRYLQSPKGKATRARYCETPKCKATKRSYRISFEGRVAKAKSGAKRRAAKKIDATLSAAEWKKILQAHKSRCYWCKTKLKASAVTMDHVVPLSKGGQHTKENVVPACQHCNSSKQAQLWSFI